MMTSTQVVKTSVNVTSNSPSQDYTHPDNHNLPNYDVTPGFKAFTMSTCLHILHIDLHPYLVVQIVRICSLVIISFIRMTSVFDRMVTF